MSVPISSWQNAIDPHFIQRLFKPLTQPGVIPSELAHQILDRMEMMAGQMPLVDQLTRRQTPMATNGTSIPIVYAQPLPIIPSQTITSTPVNTPLAASGSSNTVIQAKFESPTVAQNVTSNTTINSFTENQVTENSTPLPIVHPQLPEGESTIQPTVAVNPIIFPNARSLPAPPSASLPSAPPIVSGSYRSTSFMQRSEEPRQNKTQPTLPLVRSQPGRVSGSNSALGEPLLQVRVSQSLSPNLRGYRSETIANQEMRPNSADFLPKVQANSVENLPTIQSRRPLPGKPSGALPGPDMPLVFANAQARSTPVISMGNIPNPSLGPGSIQTPTNLPVSLAQPNMVASSHFLTKPPSPPPVDVEMLADKVERKLLRRMTVERERRGYGR